MNYLQNYEIYFNIITQNPKSAQEFRNMIDIIKKENNFNKFLLKKIISVKKDLDIFA